MLLARNIERFSVGCPSVFHSISLYMGVLITHRFSSKPLENKFYCFPICLQFVYTPNDVSALIASIVYFGIYWQKQTVFFTRLFWCETKSSFILSLRNELHVKSNWHPSHHYPLASFTEGGLNRKLIGFKAAKSDQQSSAGNYVFFKLFLLLFKLQCLSKLTRTSKMTDQ